MAQAPGADVASAMVPDGARVILATQNRKKVEELRTILSEAIADLGEDSLICAADIELEEPFEDGDTFAENALLKARVVSRATGLIAVADDSGLVVDLMGGAPGIFSARWSGKHGDDKANNDLLLAQLEGFKEHDRGAKFVCAAALVSPLGEEYVEYGELPGTLLMSPVGDGGFGYDPIFQPNGHVRSLAQLTPEEKNAMSHRGQAFRALVPRISAALAQQSVN
ncbi:non-canonical purine NTP pyrophosphatase, RdgB/HAM1 family [Bowdeniella nasicola]|uniref:dITP/XTP pyrophosphatase n=1 Tax=Bowdeniella nasicola TaxID=208480 RepID=A0A1Q5Q3I4_9ACTO|nr:RdgB/HAM1 family non-canonical purine NTP pyrophosphatase [Bowdeniella nasicola]OKL54376.1 non-canonical purine NTP pyrophosphatase, RdgB/HAM1 family [Bowdeniella nasicola]